MQPSFFGLYFSSVERPLSYSVSIMALLPVSHSKWFNVPQPEFSFIPCTLYMKSPRWPNTVDTGRVTMGSRAPEHTQTHHCWRPTQGFLTTTSPCPAPHAGFPDRPPCAQSPTRGFLTTTGPCPGPHAGFPGRPARALPPTLAELLSLPVTGTSDVIPNKGLCGRSLVSARVLRRCGDGAVGITERFCSCGWNSPPFG